METRTYGLWKKGRHSNSIMKNVVVFSKEHYTYEIRERWAVVSLANITKLEHFIFGLKHP